MRVWKEAKLHLVSIILVAGLLVYSAYWAAELYQHDGWRILFYPAALAYTLVRLIQIGRDRTGREERAILEKAELLEKTDPAAALNLLDSYFVTRHAATARERALLWESPSHDRKAAIKLERLLKEELRGHRLMRKKRVAAAPAEQRAVALEMVDRAEQRTRDDLERVGMMLKQLKA